MPIKFRCKYCHQRLGIGSRKAGTQVKCPTCGGSVTVPFKDQEGMDDPAATEQPLFERSDFDDLFPNPTSKAKPGGPVSGTAAPAPAAAPPHPWAGPAPFALEGERPIPPPIPVPLERSGEFPSTPGIVLSPGRATALTVAAIILLAVAFGAGLVVGRYWL
jgi:hypothetical protein